MPGLLKDIFVVLALAVALFTLGWFTEPTVRPLRIGRTCNEIMHRLAGIKDRSLTPAEQTKVVNCDEQ